MTGNTNSAVIIHLPIVGEGPVLDEITSSQVDQQLRDINPVIADNLGRVALDVLSEAVRDHPEANEGPILMSIIELGGWIHRATRRGGTQVAVDLDGSFAEVIFLEGMNRTDSPPPDQAA
jgi:hypothetical protein